MRMVSILLVLTVPAKEGPLLIDLARIAGTLSAHTFSFAE